jgi:AbrB family looped-hinge helix DNA binding protein
MLSQHVVLLGDAMATVVTSKGQVTIPKAVRDLMGIKPGSAVTFELDREGRVILSKAGKGTERRRGPSRFERLRGSAGPGMSTDELMALLRGDD